MLDKTGWTVDDVDLFEVNEAFAVVAMAAMHDLQIPRDKLNVNSGACALDIRGQSKITPDPATTTMPTILL